MNGAYFLAMSVLVIGIWFVSGIEGIEFSQVVLIIVWAVTYGALLALPNKQN